MYRKPFKPTGEGEEENALVVPSEAMGPAKYADDEAFTEISQSSGFLPFLSIVAKTSDLTAKGFQGGNIALKRGQEVTDLGAEISGLVLGWRFRAMSFGGDEVISVFDPNDPKFKEIMVLADTPGNQGEMYGPEFLVFSPAVQPGGFALYMMGNSSSRREAPSLKAILEEWRKGERKVPSFTLSARFHQGRKFSWYIPVIKVCSAPIAPQPTPDEVSAQLETFNNPPKDEREKVDEGDGEARER